MMINNEIKEKLLLRIKKTELRHKKEIQGIYQEYCEDNSKAIVGDIVTDGQSIIIVERITGMMYCSTTPDIIFKGIELTKKLKEKKSGEGGCVGQNCDSFKIIKAAKQRGE